MLNLVIHYGETVLVDGDLHSGAIVLRGAHTAKHQLDVSRRILAEMLVFFDRATKEGQLSFSVNRQHASEADALNHFFTHRDEIGGVADLVIDFEDADGVTHTWTAEACGWDCPNFGELPMGIATVATYTVGITKFIYTNDGDGGTGTGSGTWDEAEIDNGTTASEVTEWELDGGCAADCGADYPGSAATIDGGDADNLQAA